MNKNIHYSSLLVLLFIYLLAPSCKKTHQPKPEKEEIKKTFVLPDIPVMLTSAEDKNRYLALHYFDRFNFNDTTLIHQPDVCEQGIVDFIDFVKNAPKEIADTALTIVFKKASINTRMYAYFWEKMDKYLDDPNSPARNEDLYIAACEGIAKAPQIDMKISSNAAFNLQQALKNRPGTKATDFRITLSSGKQLHLKSLSGKYVLLFFYEPDCHTCIQAKKLLRESEFLNKLIQQSIVNVLAFYPSNDKELWLKWLPECADNWINGYDSAEFFSEKTPYFVRAYPTYYLLDKDKKVLLKDEPIEVVFSYLQQALAQ